MTIKPIEFTEYQGWNEWEQKFRPIKNPFRKTDPNEMMFETYGEEVEFVAKTDNNYVWTYLQGDYSDLIVAGFHYVNRIGYYISQEPWTNEDDYVLLSVEKECDCFIEDGHTNKFGEVQDGDENCELCEGYGRYTDYV